ncbi:helix-turn-helix transcriptional regulator [Herbiconiux ginsengi]|uniref:Regulatory protein, luxR family n=1 Tax=Herbiconiux ginsengi TaxID=381665 RepID=A0A1H3MQ05_9MICO|nr:helix-turn-helix transcriptional regulator [Herbiconiux ginsengi]SDY78563.1 regulatory protein, luxR family [Herbiconiux ginsengi]
MANKLGPAWSLPVIAAALAPPRSSTESRWAAAGPTGATLEEHLRDHVANRDWGAVLAVLQTEWVTQLLADPQGLRTAIESLPVDILQQAPGWVIARSYLDRLVGPAEKLTTSYRHPPITGTPRTLMDVLVVLTSKIADRRATGRMAAAAAGAAEARALLAESDDEAIDGLHPLLPDLHYQWGMAWEYAEDLDRAALEYTDSFNAAVLAGHRFIQAAAAGSVAWVHALAGRNIQARHWLRRVPDPTGEWWEDRASITARFARTHLLLDELREQEAGVELAKVDLAASPERWPAQKYLAAITEKDPSRSFDVVTQIDSNRPATDSRPENEGQAPIVAVARSILLTRVGDFTGSRNAIRQLTDAADTGGFGSQLGLLWDVGAALLTEDHSRVAREAAMLIQSSFGTPRILIGALALRAAAARRTGDTETASNAFELASQHARRHRLYLSLTLIPRTDLAELLALHPGSIPDHLHEDLLSNAVSDGAHDPFRRLSAREREVATTAVRYQSIAEIAAALFVSTNTIKTQLRSIYRKVGINSLEELRTVTVSGRATA